MAGRYGNGALRPVPDPPPSMPGYDKLDRISANVQAAMEKLFEGMASVQPAEVTARMMRAGFIQGAAAMAKAVHGGTFELPPELGGPEPVVEPEERQPPEGEPPEPAA